jgi:hypothetical protein
MNLANYVPDFINQSSVFSPLYEEEQNELNTVNADITDLVNQCFVETATWGLSDWESFLGIPANSNTNAIRVTNILAKIRGRGTSTVALVQNVANSYANGTVQVIEHPANYAIEIKFVSDYGIPPNLSDLQNAISAIIPAHLEILYTYLYTIWQSAQKVTWNTIKTDGTWGNLRSGQDVTNS